jgi:hypothetical protein
VEKVESRIIGESLLPQRTGGRPSPYGIIKLIELRNLPLMIKITLDFAEAIISSE